MLTIIVQVDAPPGQAIGIKEDLAQHLERVGSGTPGWCLSPRTYRSSFSWGPPEPHADHRGRGPPP